MTQNEKDLLLKDLCGRLPYGVKLQFSHIITSPAVLKGINEDFIECDIAVCELEDIKPYLFPMSSMTKEQRVEYCKTLLINNLFCSETPETYDWLDANHFDYRGLIEKGLAIDCTDLDIY